MSWRKKITARSLEELHEKASTLFAPGTTYAIYSIKDSGSTGTRTHFRAHALPPGAAGNHRTPDSAIPRPSPGLTPKAPEMPIQGVTEERAPVWKPVAIPPAVLRAAPAQSRSIHLLTDRDDMIPGTSNVITEDHDIMELLEHAAPPEDAIGDSGSQVLYVGLLEDAVLAAESDGHISWTGAGELPKGDAGATTVCYGLGSGINAARLSEGIRAYDGLQMILVVDPSRKTADTVAWVSEIIKVAIPSSIIPLSTAYTASPETINEIRRLIY